MKGKIAVSYLQGLAGPGWEGYMEIPLVFKYGEVGVFLLDKIGPVVVTRAGTQRAVGGNVADLNMPSTVAPATDGNQVPRDGDKWDSPGVGARLRPPDGAPTSEVQDIIGDGDVRVLRRENMR